MKKVSLRIVRGEGHTKDGHTFPRYYAIYEKAGERAYIDVSFTGDTLNTFTGCLTSRKSNYLDVSLPFAQKKEERDSQHAFIAPKRKKNADGSYSYITDRKGNRIPHIVVTKLDPNDIYPVGKEIKLPESKTEKEYEVDNFFKGASDNDTHSDLPF